MEESKKGAFQTLAYLKKEYSMMIKIHQELLNILIKSKQHVDELDKLFHRMD